MTNEEMERLASAIAAELRRVLDGARGGWVPAPVRPAPPETGQEPPAWAAAAQVLGDLAPVRRPEASRHRDGIAEATRSIRAAAAGKGASTLGNGARGRAASPGPRATARGGAVTFPVGVSNRHVHLSAADAAALFGGAALEAERPLKQPGQFAARQRVTAVGPAGRIEGIRVVGPSRGSTQLELALSDAHVLGISPPVANSGMLTGSGGGITLEGPNGRVALSTGVIIAARHLHLSVEDAKRLSLADGDRLVLRCGLGPRETTWHGVLVRAGEGHATEFHLDADEARAAGVTSGEMAVLVARSAGTRASRPLVTERDVLLLASRGEALPAGALLTPSARDRARMLGLAGA